MLAKNHLGAGLSFVAGYVDTVGFISLFGLFTAHVTGNFVLIGSELARPWQGHGVLIKLLAFPSFVAAVMLTCLLVSYLKRRKAAALVPVLLMQMAFLLLFMLCGWLAMPIREADNLLAICAGCAGAAAMGIQNAASRLIMSDIAPTTVMTGNVTQLVIELMAWITGGGKAAGPNLSKYLWPVATFAAGAIGGGYACMRWEFWSLSVPLLILAGIALCWRSE